MTWKCLEEFNAIIREKQKYERMKENVRNVSEKQENARLNNVNLKKKNEFVNNLRPILLSSLTIHFKHFLLNGFDLNSNSKSLFERFSISDFLVDCLMCICT